MRFEPLKLLQNVLYVSGVMYLHVCVHACTFATFKSVPISVEIEFFLFIFALS